MPAGWAGRRVYLHFDGVDSAFYVWVNGTRVGYSEDSRTPAEFDVTEYLADGPNMLAVEVYRWSDGSYLEDQDMFRLSGIFRDVYLWSRPAAHIRDFEVRADLDARYQDAHAAGDGRRPQRRPERRAPSARRSNCFDADGQRRRRPPSRRSSRSPAAPRRARIARACPCAPRRSGRPRRRTSTPRSSRSRTPRARCSRSFPSRVGFRKVEIKNAQHPRQRPAAIFKGVNRHEHSPTPGHYVDARAG